MEVDCVLPPTKGCCCNSPFNPFTFPAVAAATAAAIATREFPCTLPFVLGDTVDTLDALDGPAAAFIPTRRYGDGAVNDRENLARKSSATLEPPADTC
jgi:hypothetical protein